MHANCYATGWANNWWHSSSEGTSASKHSSFPLSISLKWLSKFALAYRAKQWSRACGFLSPWISMGEQTALFLWRAWPWVSKLWVDTCVGRLRANTEILLHGDEVSWNGSCRGICSTNAKPMSCISCSQVIEIKARKSKPRTVSLFFLLSSYNTTEPGWLGVCWTFS